MESIKEFCCRCCNHGAVVAPENEYIKTCGVCFEEGAKQRPCCNCLFCDHCYTKNKACPNCKQSTRQEKMTGATYTVISYSDHEECRTCLEPGLKRRCCGNYYCDECFYKQPTCKSCGTPINNVGRNLQNALLGRASLTSVLLGWGMAAFVILCFFGLVSTLSASEALTPKGIFGNTCYGLFRTCDKHVCLSMPESVADGTTSFPDLTEWPFCDLDSTVKLEASACVFDSQLYTLTGTHAGYDVCADKFRKGVYIMEDNFENWINLDFWDNQMKSAKWANIINGIASERCGHGVGGSKTLTFNGDTNRYAETLDFDLSSGGWLEGDLFLSPQGFDFTHPECKSAYSGGISVEFSNNSGASFNIMKKYDAWEYRSVNFFHIELHLPPGAITNNTRFRFRQEFFDLNRDHWALDNIKVFRYLPDDWHTSSMFQDVYQQSKKNIEWWQCCFDSEWCTQRLSVSEQARCNIIPYYTGEIFVLRGAELFVCLCAVINFIKFVYILSVDWLVRDRYPFQDEVEALAKWDWLMKQIPARYRPKKNIEDFVSDIHKSARLAEEMREMMEEQEQQGETLEDIKKRTEVIKKEKEAKRKEIRKERKRLKERMKKRGYQGPGLESLEKIESDEEEEEEGENFKDLKFNVNQKLATDEDKLKRGNMALLRIPFGTKNDWVWRQNFAIGTILVFAVVVMWRISTTSYYIVFEDLTLFGTFSGTVELTSLGINFLGFLCDFKELYYTLKHIVPIRDDWIPQITVDLSADVNSLFIGSYTIPLQNITEHNNFSSHFIRGCALCYAIGAFPFCMFSLVLRNQFLPYAYMRIVSPVFGTIICFRAVLGPAFLLKCFFSLYYFFDFNVITRERVGRALMTARATLSASTTAAAVFLFATFVGTMFFFKYAGIIIGLAIVLGYVYGLCTGCMHSLPIKPWMYITCLEPGIWLRVQKKQRCPCIYWGAFCTDIHNYEEIFVVYPTDEVRFRFVVTGNVNPEDG